MKKILVAVSLAAGALIPLFTYTGQFYFISTAAVLGIFFILIRRTNITIYDFLTLFVVFIPFHDFRLGTQTVFLRLTELAFIPLAFLWFARRLIKDEGAQRKNPMREYAILALFIAISLLSAAAKALLPAISVYRTLVLTYLVVFSFIVGDMIRDEKKLFSAVRTLLIVSALSGIWGLFGMFFPRLSFFYRITDSPIRIGSIKFFRASGAWGNPNYFALFLSIVIPVTAGMLMSRLFPREKRLLKICLVLQIIGLLATLSRNGLISTVAAFLFLLWFFKKRSVLIIASAAFVLFVSSLWIGREYLYTHQPSVYSAFLRVPLPRLEHKPELLLVYRWDAWKANIRMFLDNPILGVGPFMAGENYVRYRPPNALYPRSAGRLEPHNEYLSLLSERGIFGFLLFAVFLALLLRRGISAFSSEDSTQRAAIARGLTAGVFSFFIAGFGEATLTDVTFWLVVGLLFATCDLIKRTRTHEQ